MDGKKGGLNQAPRALILRGGAVGDFVLTLPVAQAIRAHWPRAHIGWVGHPHIVRLAQPSGPAQTIHPLGSADVSKLFSREGIKTTPLRKVLASCDWIISFFHDPDGQVRENLRESGPGRVVYQSPLHPAMHISDHLFQSVHTIWPELHAGTPRLTADPASAAKGREWLQKNGLARRPMAIHGGSGSLSKNWPWPRFLELARRLRADGWQPFFTAGEAEESWVAQMGAEARGIGPVWPQGSLSALMGVLSHARGYLGNDSGITHLTAALGVRVVALFGPTDPAIWAPRGRLVRVVCAPQGCLNFLAVDEVEAAVTAMKADMKDSRPE